MRGVAEAGGKIPGEALEAGRPRPALRVAVHARGHLAEEPEFVGEMILFRGLDAALPFEEHDMARSCHGRMADGLDDVAVRSGDRLRCDHDAVVAERL